MAAQQLTPVQRSSLESGQPVVIAEAGASSPWPALTVWRVIDATPEESAAIFVDYEAQSSYVPNLMKSVVSKRVDPTTTEVDYVLAVPIVRNEEYTVRDVLTRDSGGGYRVDWTLVRATSTLATVGYARFIPFQRCDGHAATLLEYHNVVTPGSRLATLGFIRTRARRQVEQTVEAIVRRVESGRSESAMTAKVTALRAALSASAK